MKRMHAKIYSKFSHVFPCIVFTQQVRFCKEQQPACLPPLPARAVQWNPLNTFVQHSWVASCENSSMHSACALTWTAPSESRYQTGIVPCHVSLAHFPTLRPTSIVAVYSNLYYLHECTKQALFLFPCHVSLTYEVQGCFLIDFLNTSNSKV